MLRSITGQYLSDRALIYVFGLPALLQCVGRLKDRTHIFTFVAFRRRQDKIIIFLSAERCADKNSTSDTSSYWKVNNTGNPHLIHAIPSKANQLCCYHETKRKCIWRRRSLKGSKCPGDPFTHGLAELVRALLASTFLLSRIISGLTKNVSLLRT